MIASIFHGISGIFSKFTSFAGKIMHLGVKTASKAKVVGMNAALKSKAILSNFKKEEQYRERRLEAEKKEEKEEEQYRKRILEAERKEEEHDRKLRLAAEKKEKNLSQKPQNFNSIARFNISNFAGKMKTSGMNAASKAKGISSSIFSKLFAKKMIFLILLVIFMLFVFWFGFPGLYEGYSNTAIGQKYSQQLREFFGPSVYEFKRESMGPINMLYNVVVLGRDPTEIMSAQEVNSNYSEIETLRIKVDNFQPTRDFFLMGQPLSVRGDLTVEGGIQEKTPIEFEIKQQIPFNMLSSLMDSDFFKDLGENIINGQEVSGLICDWQKLNQIENIGRFNSYCIYGNSWECRIRGSDEVNKFELRDRYNLRLICTNPGIKINEDLGENLNFQNVIMEWKYSTSALVGKQIYVFEPSYAEINENPLTAAGVSSNAYRSWSISEDNVGVGIGIDKQNDYVIADISTDQYLEIWFIAFTIKNNGYGDIVKVNSVTVTLPDNPAIQVITEYGDFENPVKFERLQTYPDGRTETLNLVNYSLNKEAIKVFRRVSSQDYHNFYLPIVVDKSFLGNSRYNSFPIIASIDYTYKDTTLIEAPLKIRTLEVGVE